MLEGDGPSVLIQAGWRPRQGTPVGKDTPIEITVHPLKTGVDPASVIPADAPELIDSARSGHVGYVAGITLSDGRKVTFGGNK